MGIKTSDKHVDYSYQYAQTKQQVGKCIIGALLVHERATNIHGLTKLTTVEAWGKPL